MATQVRVHRARRRIRTLRHRPHDMFEATDYDFPDDYEVEDWMVARTKETTNGEMGS
jgi:hypothetical protein